MFPHAMTGKKLLACLFAVSAAGVMSAADAAALPWTPLQPYAAGQAKVPFQTEGREFSASFQIRFANGLFASKNGGLYRNDLFEVSRNPEGCPVIRLFTDKSDLMGPVFQLTGKDALKNGAWHHVCFNFSMERRRASLYIDGHLQYEIVTNVMPQLPLTGTLKTAEMKGVEVKDLTVWDAALESEKMIAYTPSAAELNALKQELESIKTNNPCMKNYIQSLLKQSQGSLSRYAWKQLQQEASNAVKLAARPGADANTPVISIPVTAISQEIRTPYAYPQDAAESNTVYAMAAKDEFEPASFLAFSLTPVKKLEVFADPLDCKGKKLPSDAMDIRIVKRWVRCGGAWLSYHADRRQRVLTPDLLLKDDRMMLVDEDRMANYVRLDYPGDTQYRNVSHYSRDNGRVSKAIPVRDAKTLQSVAIPDAGRSQQFWITFHAPKDAEPGIYRTTIRLRADGKDAGSLPVVFRVLPFELPVAATRYDLNKEFYCDMTFDANANDEIALKELINLREHNIRHPNFTDPDRYGEPAFVRLVELFKKAGLPLDYILAGGSGDQTWRRTFSNPSLRTLEYYKRQKKAFGDSKQLLLDCCKKYLGHTNIMFYGNDEAGAWTGLDIQQRPGWEEIEERGGKLRAAGWTDNFRFMADIQNSHSITTIKRQNADYWHSVGGSVLNYAAPFAGAENPLFFRRNPGLLMYSNDYDGLMLLSYLCNNWNEIAFDSVSDGNYRNFGMVYAVEDGVVDTMAYEGLREAYDDVRYLTLLKKQATAALTSNDLIVRREAKRQLAWAARIDGERDDLDSVRVQAVDRILTLQKLMETRKGK